VEPAVWGERPARPVDTVLGMSTALGSPRVLRPLRHLPWRSTAAGNIAMVAPGAAVAAAIAIRDARPVMAALVLGVVAVYSVIVVVPALRIRMLLDEDGVTTMWARHRGAKRIERSVITHAVIRTIYNGDGVSTNRHLFLLDESDRPVHRMSTRWWTDEQLLTIAHHFHVPLDSQTQPVHLVEVRRTAPHHLAWSERHRVLAGIVLVAGGFVLCFAFAWLTTAAA
jgi:hypothetical protein